MKITIELDDNDINKLSKSQETNMPTLNDIPYTIGYDMPDVCKSCPNRPGGPNNKSGFCNCILPSMNGPWKVTC